ncbi:MAG TPA: methyltransferase domain-containing protein [Solirubrobacterales bacterium]|nr:methyltransferase domain-containing protein [Solirubrobacterales bacterium]
MSSVAPDNAEATEAWSGPLFEIFLEYRDLTTGGLGAHGEIAMRANPPRAGQRAIDIGCGFGDTTQRLAELVEPEGSVLGVDVSAPFIETARQEADDAGLDNVEFRLADVQTLELPQEFDYAFSRMGIMFFANPVAALRNVRAALKPGGRFTAVVWRRKLDNEWVRRAEEIVDEYLDHPEESDEPTCGPGPFSMANADTVSEQLKIAGFEEIALRRCDLPMKVGANLDQAVEFGMALGPAGEILRLWGDRVDEIRPEIAAKIRAAIADFEGPDGVYAPASTWIITARVPDNG